MNTNATRVKRYIDRNPALAEALRLVRQDSRKNLDKNGQPQPGADKHESKQKPKRAVHKIKSATTWTVKPAPFSVVEALKGTSRGVNYVNKLLSLTRDEREVAFSLLFKISYNHASRFDEAQLELSLIHI